MSTTESTSTRPSTTTTSTSTITTSSTSTTTSTSSTSTTSKSSTTTSSSVTPSTTTTLTPTASPTRLVTSTTQEKPPTTLFITTTNDRGALTTSAPSIITSVLTSTASNGAIVTVTEVGVNQTLSPDNNSSNSSSFFRNTGAVAGVFILVGLATASILLWIFFAVRRRRRTQRLEHDTAVSATLAAAGFHRSPLDDDDDNIGGSRQSRLGSPDVEMIQRSSSGLAIGTASSIPSAGRASAYIDSPHPDDQDPFNPYSDYTMPFGVSGYPTTPPPVAFYNGPYRDRSESRNNGGPIANHSASHSAGSYEPLLASFQPSGPPSPAQLTDPFASSRNHSQKPSDTSQPLIPLPDPHPAHNNIVTRSSSHYSSESMADDRLDPGLRRRLNEKADRASMRDLRDEEDYSRPVLGVRNLPDTTSQVSQES